MITQRRRPGPVLDHLAFAVLDGDSLATPGPRTSPMPASIMRASSWRADTPHSNSGIPTASPLNWWRREGGRPRGDPGAAESVSEDDRRPVRSSTAPRTRLVSDTGQCRLRALLGWADVDVPGAIGAVPRPALRRKAPPPAVSGVARCPHPREARPKLEEGPLPASASSPDPGGQGPPTRFLYAGGDHRRPSRLRALLQRDRGVRTPEPVGKGDRHRRGRVR